ncbi:MAG: hypothetical protein KKD44_06670 [Proteobacteria bacterium]|nr:hypothetical protein [Pseudomonadota bacterium]
MKNVNHFKQWIIGAAALLIIGNTGVAYAADVGVAWVGKSGMADRVNSGFEKGIREIGQGINLLFHKDLDDLDTLAAVVKEYESKMDGMVILRSNGAKWLGNHPPTIPTFIGGCNHPVQLGVLQNMDSPEGKITGVTYYLPVATQFETFQAIIPDLKSVLLLLGAGNPSAEVDRKETQMICGNLGLKYHEKMVENTQDAIAAVREFKGKVSMMIIGNQGKVFDIAKELVTAADKTPVVSYSSEPVKDGALGGFVADDEILGYMLAQSVVDVLVNGKAIKQVPVKVDPKPTFCVNVTTAQKLDVKIPYEILSLAKVIE